MHRFLFSLCLILLVMISNTYAKEKYSDADSIALENIAQNALQNSKIVEIKEGKVIEIIGIVSEIEGEVLEIEAVLKDLNAKVSETKIKIEMSGDILFNFDKATIRKVAEPTLKNVVEVIKKYNAKNVLIEGHTDSKGSDSYNLRLSKDRADSVKYWLIRNSNISTQIIKTKGWGEIKPIAPNTKYGSDNPEGRQKNRRVEITIHFMK